MRDYQRTKNNPYFLPKPIYRMALALVRAYPHMCSKRDEIIMESSEGHGGSGVGRPTEAKAMRISVLDDNIHAVDRALAKIPREYRQGVMDNIINGIRTDNLFTPAGKNTWSRWRGRLLYHVARGKHWI